MKQRGFLRAVALLLAGCCLLLAGCTSRIIQEDRLQDNLPVLDPEDGVARDISVVLYYRLTGEAYLVPVTRNISARANERTETAMIRTLLEGVPQQSLSGNVSATFPEGTKLVDVSRDSGILYVTLSREFLDTSNVEAVRQATSSYGNTPEGQQRAQQAIQLATEEMYLMRRMGVYSLVNTLCEYSREQIRVQILVDVDGSGEGERLPLEEMGLDPWEKGSDLIEPLEYEADAVVTPERIVSCMLSRMVSGEYEMAYVLFMEAPVAGVTKPTYANFESEILGLGNVTGFEILSSQEQKDGSYSVWVNLDFRTAAGEQCRIQDAQITLRKEGDLYKIGYGSFKSILEGAA